VSDDGWGPGDKFEQFDHVIVEGQTLELGRGEHKHTEGFQNNWYVKHPWGVVAFDGHRTPIKIEIEEYNYMKESELSGDEVRKMCRSKIWINGKVARANDGPRTAKAHLRLVERQLLELFDGQPSVWHDGEALIGRKIYYGRIPATIVRIDVEDAELHIEPVEGQTFDPSAYAIEEGPQGVADWLDDYGTGMRIKDSDPHIWWWRENG
jgi:hypothetical protein